MNHGSFFRPRSGANRPGTQQPQALPGMKRFRADLRGALMASVAGLAAPTPKMANRRNRRAGRTAIAVGTTLGAYIVSSLLSAAHANPTGGTVTVGQAVIDASKPNTLTITQGTDKAAINWQSFSIGAGEKVDFLQPSSSSVILNRVIGNDPSSIFGQLTANGTVMLVNPNGVVFGAGSRVDVGSLVATTANISDADFLAGRYAFNQASANPNAAIVNAGDITIKDSGLAALVAPSVRNSGVIHARLGRVALGGAQTFTLDFQGDGLLSFDASSAVTALPHNADGTPAQALVVNSGQIAAEGGTIELSARAVKGVIDHVINTDGVLVATSVSAKNGKIVLSGGDSGTVAVNGTLNASGKDAGQTGGTVIATGADVAVATGAVVDASGDAGGGHIAIGSDGTGTTLDTAKSLSQSVSLAAGATLNADAVTSGNGGRVSLLSEDSTLFSGTISAKGGARGGDGGFTEVSSHNGVALAGDVSLQAPKGKTGTLLLDPTTLTITSGTSGSGSQDSAISGGTLASTASDVGLNTVSSGKIVALTATSDVVLQASGLITVGNLGTVNLGSGHSLTLQSTATGGITFTNPSTTEIVASGGGNITLQSLGIGSTITNVAKLTSDTGVITITANGNVTLANTLTGSGVGITSVVGSITNVGAPNLITGSGSGVILSAQGGSIGTATSTISTHTLGLGLETGGSLYVTNDQTLLVLALSATHAHPGVINTYQLTSPGLTFDATDTGSLNLNTLQQSSTLYAQVSTDHDAIVGNVNVTSSGVFSLTSTGGNILAGAGNTGATPITAASVQLTAQGTTGLNGAVGSSASPLQTDTGILRASAGSGGIYVGNGSTLALQSAVASGTVNVATAGTLTVGAVAGGTVTLASTGGAILDDADATTSISANSLNLSASTGVGTHGGALISNAATVQATTNTGGVFLNLTNAVVTTLANVSAGAGAVEVATATNTVATTVSSGGGSGDDITITVTGGALAVNTINAGASGNVTLTTTLGGNNGDGIVAMGSGSLITGRNLVLSTSSYSYVQLYTAVQKVSGTSGTGITIEQRTGDLTVGDLATTYVPSSSGNPLSQPTYAKIKILADDGSVTVAGTVKSLGSTAYTGSVEIQASGAILADSGVTTAITSDSVELEAGQNVGTTASHVKTNTTELYVSAVGDIYLDNAVAFTELSIDDQHTSAGVINTVAVTAPYLTFGISDDGSKFTLTNIVGTTIDSLSFASDETLVLGHVQGAADSNISLRAYDGDILDDGNSQTRVTGYYVALQADSGKLGTSASPLNINAPRLVLTTEGDLYASDIADLTTLSLTTNHRTNGSVNTYQLTAPSLVFNMTDSTSGTSINTLTDVTGLSATYVNDRTTTLGDINVTRSGSLNLTAQYGSILDDANTATQALAGSITLTATWTAGGLGTAANPLQLATGDLKVAANSGGTYAQISMPVNSTTNVVKLSTGNFNSGTMMVEALQGDLALGTITTTGQSVTLKADAGSITNPNTSSSSTPSYSTLTVGSGGTVSLTASGAIGGSTAPILISASGGTLNATATAGDVYVTNAGALKLGAISASGTVGVTATSGSLTDDGDGTTTVAGTTVALTAASGSAGTSASPLSVATANLAVTAQGSIQVADSAALSNLTLASTSTSAGNSFSVGAANLTGFALSDSGSLYTLTQLTSTSALNFTFTGGHAITVLGPVNGNAGTANYGISTDGGAVALASTAGNVTIGSITTGGGAATITSGAGGALTVTSLATGGGAAALTAGGVLTVTGLTTTGGAATLTSGTTAALSGVDTGNGALGITVGSGDFTVGALAASSVSINAKAGNIKDDGDSTTKITAGTVSLTSGTGSIGVAGTSDSDTSKWIALSGTTNLTLSAPTNMYVVDDHALTALALSFTGNNSAGIFKLTAPTQTYIISSASGTLSVNRAGATSGGTGDLSTFSLYARESVNVGTVSATDSISVTTDNTTANIGFLSGFGGLISANGTVNLTTKNANASNGNIGTSTNSVSIESTTLNIDSVGAIYVDDAGLANLSIISRHASSSDNDNNIKVTGFFLQSSGLIVGDGATQSLANGSVFAAKNGSPALNFSYTTDRAIAVMNNITGNTVSLTSTGGSITGSSGKTITAGSVSLSALAKDASVGTSSQAVGVSTANLSIASAGSMYVADSAALSSLTLNSTLTQSGTPSAGFGITASNITDSITYSNSGPYGLQIGTFTANTGNVALSVTSNQLITVGTINTGTGTGAAVTLTTTGAIQAATSSSRITTGALTLNTTGVSIYNDGIDPFLTTASSLAGTIQTIDPTSQTVTGGSINLSNTGDLALGALTVGDTAKITTSGAITSGGGTVSAPIVTIKATGGSIGTSGAHLSIDSRTLSLDSGNDIYVDGRSDLYALNVTDRHATARANTLAITAPHLVFTVTDTGSQFNIVNVADTSGIDFTFTGDKNIQIGTVNGQVGRTVGVTSTSGSLTDNGAVMLTGDEIDLAATGSIGTAGAHIKTTALTLNVRTGANLYIDNATDLSALSVETTQAAATGGVFSITSGGAFGSATPTLTFSGGDDGTYTHFDLVTDSTGINFSGTAEHSLKIGTIDTRAAGMLAGGLVTLFSDQSILAIDGTNRITAAETSLTTWNGGGSVGSGATALNLSTPLLDMDTSGSVYLNSDTHIDTLDLYTRHPTSNASAYSITSPGLTFGMSDGGTGASLTNIVDTTGLALTVTSDATLTVGTVNLGTAGTLALHTTSGDIKGDGNGTTGVTAATLSLVSDSGAIGTSGAGNEIDAQVNTLTANAQSGAVNLGFSASAALKGLTAGGDVVLNNSVGDIALGTIELNGHNLTVDNEGGSILSGTLNDTATVTLIAQGSIGNVSAITTSSNGAATTLNLTAHATNGAAGSVNVSESNGNLVASSILAPGGVTLTATDGGITVGTINAGTAAVSLTAGDGDILAINGSNLTTAGSVTLVTDSGSGHSIGGGTGGVLIVSTPVLSLTNTKDIYLNDNTTLSKLTLDRTGDYTGGGTIQLSVPGFTAAWVDSTTTLNLTYLAQSGLDLTLRTNHNVAVGTINLGSTGKLDLEVDPASGNGAITATSGSSSITAGSLTLEVSSESSIDGSSIGSSGTLLKVSATDFTASAGQGGIYIAPTSNINLSNVTSGGALTVSTTSAVDITLGSVSYGNGQALTVTTAGAILGGGGVLQGGSPNTVGGYGAINLTAGTGIGGVNAPLQISATNNAVNATVTGTGDIVINSQGQMLGGLTTATHDGQIVITSAGSLLLNGATSSTDNSGDGISVTVSSGNLTLGGAITAGATQGNITLTANSGSILASNAPTVSNEVSAFSVTADATTGLGGSGKGLNLVGQRVNALTQGGTIYLSPQATTTLAYVSSGGGAVNIVGNGGLYLGNVLSSGGNITVSGNTGTTVYAGNVNAGSGNVTIVASSSGGAILDDGLDLTRIVGNTVSLSGATGVGTSTRAVQTTANSLTLVDNAGGAGIYVDDSNTSGVIITSSTAAGGNTVITTAGPTTVVSATATSATGGGNDITITAATGNLTIGAISTNTASLNGGTLTLTATNGSILARPGSGTNLTGYNASLSSKSGIGTLTDFASGAGAPIVTAVTNLTSLSATDAGSIINVKQTGNLTLGTGTNVTLGTNGSVYLQATGNINASSGLPNVGTGNLALLAGGTLTLPSAGVSTQGDLYLKGVTDVIATGATPRALTITADSLKFISGAAGGSVSLTTTVGALDAELTGTTTAANLTVGNTGALSGLTLSTAKGNITFTNDVGFTTTSVTASGTTPTVSLTASTGDLTVGSSGISAGATGTVNLIATTGALAGEGGNAVTAGTLNLTSLKAIGSASQSLSATAATLSATVTGTVLANGAGDYGIYLSAPGTLSLAGLTTADGVVSITGGGAGTTLTSTGGITAGNGHAITLSNGGGAISVSGTMTGASLDATATTISVGAMTTSGTQNYTGNTTITGDLTASAVTVTGNLTLGGTGARTIDTHASNGDIDITGTVTGASHDLTLTAGTGAITLGGAASGMGALSATGATIATNGVAGTGNQSYTGATTLGGTYSTGSGTFTVTGAATLGGDTSVTTTNVAVGFTSTVDGGHNLTIGSGTGAVTLTGAVGGTTRVGALTVNSTGTTTFTSAVKAGSVTTNAGGTVVLTAGTVDATGIISLGDALVLVTDTTLTGSTVTLGGTVNGAHGLTVTGNAVINGGIGSTTNLTSVSVSGTTTLSANVITTGTQTYTGATTLGANTTLTGATIGFGGTLDGAKTLAVTGNAVFSGAVGGATGLASLSVSGTSSLSGDVTTTGAQAYTGAVTLVNDTTLTGTTVTLTNGANGTTTDTQSLSVVGNLGTSGAFGSTTHLKNLSISGTASLTGTTTTGGTQTYGGAVTLAGDTTLAGTTITLNSTVNGAHSLTITGDAVIAGTIGGTTALTSLSVSGASTLSAATITTTGTQTYTGAVTLARSTGATVLNTTNSNVLFSGTVDGNGDVVSGSDGLTINAGTGNVTFSSTIGATTRAGSLQFYSAGATSFGGAIKAGSVYTDGVGTLALNTGSVDTTGSQAYGEALTLTADTTLKGSNITLSGTVDGAHSLTITGNATVSGIIGGTTALSSLSVSGTGTLSKNITTTGTQTYTGAVTLGANDILTGSTVAFGGTVNGGRTLAITGNATFADTVGATNALTSLSVSGTSGLNGGSIRTTGGQTYTGAATLGADTTLTSAGNGTVAFGGTVDGAHGLTIANGSTGNTTFGGAVGGTAALSSLSVSGTSSLPGAITTTGNQTYTGLATLSAAITTLAGGTVTLTGGADGTTADQQSLTITGNLVTGALGANHRLNNVSVSGAETLSGNVTTAGTQTYTGDVSLGANATLTGTTVTFSGTLNGAHALAVVGNADFSGVIGGTATLTSLSVSGASSLSGDVTTTGTQTYTGAVTIAGDTILTGTTVTLTNGANGTTADQQSLSIVGNLGTSGAFGAVTRLKNLSVSGTASLTGTTTTAGTQTYGGAVTLAGDTTLTGSTVTFSGTVNGGHVLSIIGNAGFGGVIGATNALTSLSVSGASSLSGNVTTTGTQTYTGAATLTGAAILTTSNGAVGFGGTLDGNKALTIQAGSGNVTFGGAVGGTTTLGTLTVNSSGATAFNGAVKAVNVATDSAGTLSLGTGSLEAQGTLTLGEAFNLTSDTVLKATTVTLSGAVNGAHSLTITGNGVLNGAIGGTTALTSLSVSGTGSLGGGAIHTTGTQTYTGAVTLTADDVLTGGTIALGSTVNGAHALTITGNATFAGAVGATNALTSLSVSGTSGLNGGGVRTTGGQTYTSAATLGADTALTTTNGAVTFAGTLDGAQALTITAGSGTVTFTRAVGGTTRLGALTVNNSGTLAINAAVKAASLTTDLGGGVTLAGGSVDTTGAQAYGEAVTLAADTTLKATSVTLNGTVDGAHSLTVTGDAAFNETVGATTALTSVSVSGDTIVNGGVIKTTGTQGYTGTVLLGGNATLTGSTVTFTGTLDGLASLAVTGNAVFGGAVGGTTALTGLSVTGTSALNGGAITTTGAQSYTGAATLGADTTLATTNGAVTFGGTLDGAHALTLTTGTGNVTLTGVVGGTTRLGDLTVTSGGATTFTSAVKAASVTTNAAGTLAINGGSVDTTGAQTYGEALPLSTDTVLKGTTVTLNGTVNNNQALTITGNAVLNGAVGGISFLTSLSVSGTTAINGGSVGTWGAQTYSGATTLGANTTLTASSAGFGGTLDGAKTLVITGDASFGGSVGGTTALASLSVGGASALNGGAVTTTGTQTYSGDITLGADTTLATTNNAVIVTGLVDGAHALTISTGSGNVILGNAVGGTTRLGALTITGSGTATLGAMVKATSLTTDAGGATDLFGNVDTMGAQTYNDAVVVGVDTTLKATTVTLNGTVDGTHALTVTGNAVLNGAVGATHALGSLSVSGTTALNGGGIKTTGGQTYSGAATLGADTTLTTTNAAVTFAGTLDGAQALTITAGSGTVTFTGTVGGTARLGALTVNNSGTLAINAAVKAASLTTDLGGGVTLAGGSVDTTGAQAYGEAVTLAADTTLKATSVILNGTVDGTHALTVTGDAAFNETAGAVTALTSVSVSGDTIVNGGGIKTTGTQGYTGAVLLGGNAALTGSTVTFTGTLDGLASLAVTGNAVFGGAVGGTTTLTGLTVSGTSALNGGAITTTGAQSYTGATTLGADTTLATTNGAVTFAGTLDGAHALTLTTGTGNVTLTGVVGGTTRLGDLTVTSGGATTFGAAVKATSVTTNAAGTLAINGGSVDTTGAQTYGEALPLSTDTVLKGTTVTLNGTVDGAHALTITGDAVLNAGVGLTTKLTTLTVSGDTLLNGHNVRTAGVQNYQGAVVLGGAATLAGDTVTFGGTLDGAYILAVNANGVFNGVVGGTTALSRLSVNIGTATLNSGAVTTSGAQSYNVAAVLGADTTLVTTDGGSIGFGTLDGAHALTINAGSGNVFLTKAVGGTTRLGALTVTGSGTTTVTSTVAAASVTTGTALVLNGGSVDTTGAQTYGGTVTLGADTVLTGSTVTLSGALDAQTAGGQSLAIVGNAVMDQAVGGTTALSNVRVSGTTLFGDPSVTTTGDQTYAGAVTLGAGTTLTSTAGTITLAAGANGVAAGGQSLILVGNTVLTGAFGGTTALNALSVTGTAALNGSVTTAGAQTYDGAVTLAGDTRLGSGGAVAFTGTVDGTQALTITAGTADVTFTGAVGGTTRLGNLNVTTGGATTFTGAVTAASVTTDAAGTLAINGGSIDTTGIQSYGERAVMGGTTVLSGSLVILAAGAGATASLEGTPALTIQGDASLTGDIGANAAFASLTVTGATTLNGGAIRAGQQTYTGLVSVAGGSVLSADTGITLGTGANGVGDLTVSTTGGDIALGTLALTGTTTVTSNGGRVQAGTVATTALSITTSGGDIAFTGPATLAGDSTLSTGHGAVTFAALNNGGALVVNAAGGDVTFAGAIGGVGGTLGTLAVNTSGATTFDGTVRATSVTTDAPGSLFLNGGSVTTTGSQTFGERAVLGADTVLTGTTITLSQGADAKTAGGQGLTVAGTLVADGALGGTTALRQVSVTGPATLTNASVTTTGDQAYSGALTLGSDTVLTGGTLTLTGGVDGAQALTLAGNAILSGAIGANQALKSLSVNGSSGLNGGNIVTTGAQTYAGAVSVAADQSLTSTGASLVFGGTVDSASRAALNLVAGDAIQASGAVGGTGPLGALTLSAKGKATFAQAVRVSSLIETAAGDVTTFHGTLVADGNGGLQLAGNGFVFDQAVSATGSAIALNDTKADGAIRFASAANVSAAAGFAQTGGASFLLPATITVTSGPITFATVATLPAGTASITTNGDITMVGLQGPTTALTMASGTGAQRIGIANGLPTQTIVVASLKVPTAASAKMYGTVASKQQSLAAGAIDSPLKGAPWFINDTPWGPTDTVSTVAATVVAKVPVPSTPGVTALFTGTVSNTGITPDALSAYVSPQVLSAGGNSVVGVSAQPSVLTTSGTTPTPAGVSAPSTPLTTTGTTEENTPR
ncbi:filamentous hemagglutinin N-terminal domain-containing protein [Nitrospirillum viridazoti]|uniref:Filamentous haemagglutinin FhaB/tRNA nuclease CdiA-like TPS domain-containing protein n=1 Tax=Nitrospirillum viridazoti CBAmc TaxID=1441467 RepID=A0A248K369_9PROT|nr:filamentous hemagglutinin N-terminal domain-containing protein [Nitrospirillum amazonense]ASG25239.1 hypothetical protein Y958_30300 [Nitrospirillum amazonense CBAmc]TWB35314.1 hypothetical protein FBZ91_11034 [Nitrospirillum amazonense]